MSEIFFFVKNKQKINKYAIKNLNLKFLNTLEKTFVKRKTFIRKKKWAKTIERNFFLFFSAK
jgi:hypothetical protein